MPKQNQSPSQKFTIRDFNRMFPTDAACLEWLKIHFYPDGIHCKICKRMTKHHRVIKRIHPT
jgi:transposase